MFSNPDYDYPCNRVFWEDDAHYARRHEVMSTKREALKELETRWHRLRGVIDAEEKLYEGLHVFQDEVYGAVGDPEFKKALDCGVYIAARIKSHKALDQQWYAEIKGLRKELSELTR